MTLKQYIASGAHTAEQIAASLGVSTHAVRKWVYGQREPDITTALAIEKLSAGKVTVAELQRDAARAA